jgi:hypothetical protein
MARGPRLEGCHVPGMSGDHPHEGYSAEIKYLTRMQSLKMSVAGKASAERLVKGITKLVSNGLMAIV